MIVNKSEYEGSIQNHILIYRLDLSNLIYRSGLTDTTKNVVRKLYG